MRIKLSYVIVGGLIYYLMFSKSKPSRQTGLEYLGYGDGNEGIVTDNTTTWA